MDAISNADRFVALLRQKLAERAETKSAKQASTQQARDKPLHGAEAVQSVAARAARAGQDDRKLRRTIVEQLLADRFGARLVNEPRFQEVVTQVSELMASDPQLGALIEEVMAEIRG